MSQHAARGEGHCGSLGGRDGHEHLLNHAAHHHQRSAALTTAFPDPLPSLIAVRFSY